MNNISIVPDVVWIAGMPRSGTTWLSQIFASSPDVRLKFCPLFSYEFKNLLDERSSAEDWEKLFYDVYRTKSDFLDQEYLRKKNLVPVFEGKFENPKNLIIKSTRFHNLIPRVLELNDKVKFVHLVRHPCATIHSWLTNPGEFPDDANAMHEWRTGSCRKNGVGEYWGFDDWKSVTTQALRLSEKYPERYKILRYENLVRGTKDCTKELFDFLNMQYFEQTESFIDLSHSRHDCNKKSVFKDPVLDERWKLSLDKSIVEQCLLEVVGTELEQFIYD
jgi:hypothetical protein